MKKVLITGTGTIAKNLAKKLDKSGYKVYFLSTSRSYYNKFPCYQWNISEEKIDKAAFQDVDVIIHLAGAGIADKKWTDSRKKELESSRIDGANLIFKALSEIPSAKPRVFISASGSNYYGTVTQKEDFTENDPAGEDYVAQLCSKWEQAALQFKELGMRTVVLRTGVVLSKQGGAVPKLSKMVKLCMGSAVGTGKQIMPWIHIDDITDMYQFVYENEQCEGAYNAVSTEKICNNYFMKSLGKILKRPICPIKVPGFLLKAIYGEMAGILLKGSQLSNKKIVDAGFQIKHPRFFDALEDVIQKDI